MPTLEDYACLASLSSSELLYLEFCPVTCSLEVLLISLTEVIKSFSLSSMHCQSLICMVTGHFVPRSFRTQVISYHFGHFVLTFIFNLVISYPVWSFRTCFYYFLENCFGYFVPTFYCFVPRSFRIRRPFGPILVISYSGQFVPTSKLDTN